MKVSPELIARIVRPKNENPGSCIVCKEETIDRSIVLCRKHFRLTNDYEIWMFNNEYGHGNALKGENFYILPSELDVSWKHLEWYLRKYPQPQND